jgi:hypothetical protein
MAQTILELKLKGVKEAQADMQRLSEEIMYQKKVQAVLKDEMKKTEKEFADGKKSTEDYKKEMAQLNIELETSKKVTRENTAQLKQNIRVVNAQEGSLDQLRASLNLLQKEYGQLNKETDEGAAKALEMSDRIEQLTLEVKSQEKAIGDTRRNVGNYEEAIQSAVGSMIPFGGQLTEIAASGGGVKGALTAITTGIAGATRAAIAFISTGIGAAIAGLAAIGAATKAWFDYNNEIRETNSLLAGITNQTGDTLNNIRRQTAAIEETLGVSAEQSAQAAKVLVEQFGISYEEALSKMQTGILATNGANDELLSSISEYSTFFADAGFSVDEFTGIVNAGFDLGIYTDKLPDALKEADIKLREQTTATRDALVNAFDEEFTDNLFSDIDTGAITTAEALETIRKKAEETGLGQQALAQVTADLFAGAGEDAGGAVKVFDALTVGISGTSLELDEYGKQLEAEIGRTVTLAEEMDEALMSDNFIAFQEALKNIGQTIKLGLIDGLSMVMEALSPVGEAFSSLGKALGFTGEKSLSLRKILQVTQKVAFEPIRLILLAVSKAVKFVSGAVDVAKKAFSGVKVSVQNATKRFEPFRKAVNKVRAAVGSFVGAFKKGFAAVRATLDGVTAYGEAVLGSLGDALDHIAAGRFKKAKNALAGIGTAGEAAYNKAFKAAMNSVKATDAVSESTEEVIEIIEDESDVIEKNTKVTEDNTSATNEAAQAEERRLEALSDVIEKEQERNMTEEELLTKRLNDKLRELELDKDITTMTEQELAARTALYDKYTDDIQAIRDKADEEERLANEKRNAENIKAVKDNFDERLKAIDEGLKMQLLVNETAHLNELRNFQGTEEQKIALQEKFQADSLELQKQAIQDQIALIEQTLAEGDLLAMLETGILDESTKALAELRNQLANVNLEIANAGKDEEGETKTLAERLGLEPEQVEKINMGIQGVEAGLDVMSQLVEARAQERFGKVDQLLQQGVINEEEAERRKEQIKKDAARKQQKIDVTQAVINTAKAVTSALNTQPFLPAGLIMAGIATAQGAAQIKMIRAQKFAKGGILNGPSHSQGGIPMFSKGGAFYGEAEGGEAIMTKGVMANPALASMASAINVAGGGVPFFANGGVLDPIQSATPTDRAADIISAGLKSRQPVLVVEQLRERENSVDVIESLRTIG